jgi:hypothetical protein
LRKKEESLILELSKLEPDAESKVLEAPVMDKMLRRRGSVTKEVSA